MTEPISNPVTVAPRQPDRETRDLLTMMSVSDHPPIWALDVPAARALYDPMTVQSAHESEPVYEIEERSIAANIAVRIYRPAAAASPRPALLFFHGGGGVIGNLESHDAICRTLANAADTIVIAVDYRLGPEHPFPAAFEDAWSAYEWLVSSAASIGVDPARIAVGGDSAGGGLAAAVTAESLRRASQAPAFQLLLCPSLDATRDARRYPSLAENSSGYFMTHELMDWFLANYLNPGVDRADPHLSPLLGELRGRPPATLLATAGFDPLRDEGKAYADRLSAAGGQVVYRCYENTIHDFFSFGRFLASAAPALRECAVVMRESLVPELR